MTPDVLVRPVLRQLARELALLFGELRRQHGPYRDVEIPKSAGRPRHALAGQPDRPPILRLRRDAQRHPALQRRHGDLRAEERFVQRDRQLRAQIVAVADEERMRAHANAHVNIARRPAALARAALTGEPDALAVAHAGGDLHVQSPGSPAVGARDLHRALRAPVGLGEADLHLGLVVLARSSSRAPSRARPAEDLLGRAADTAVACIAEQRAEEVREPPGGIAERIGGAVVDANGRPAPPRLPPPPPGREVPLPGPRGVTL